MRKPIAVKKSTVATVAATSGLMPAVMAASSTPPPDRLGALLKNFSLAARLFHAGPLCGVVDFDETDVGYLHVIRKGPLRVTHRHEGDLVIDAPTLLFYPRPLGHRFIADKMVGAQMTCASVRFASGGANPLARALPPIVALPLDAIPGITQSTAILFSEAHAPQCGRQAVVDRLFEVVIIQLIRHLMATNAVNVGLLAGLAHPQLQRAIIAMHEFPAAPWSIESLAERAAMSRSAFAAAFRETVGVAPGDYLASWRISLAQTMVKQGRALKTIAADVGYGSEVALSRAFSARVGMSARAYRLAEMESR
jgi:AraC-like DNA-binding protein